MTEKLPNLNELLQYKNEYVINRYIKETGTSRKKANQIFTELLKFFWVSQKSKLSGAGIPIPMYDEMDPMDQMWHTFILFTREYFDFSEQYFGEYFHHKARYGGGKSDVIYTDEDFFDFYGFVFDHVGIDSLNFWLATPRKTALENSALQHSMSPLELKNHAFAQSYRRFFRSKVPEALIFKEIGTNAPVLCQI